MIFRKTALLLLALALATNAMAQIDRAAVLKRNNPIVTKADPLAALSVGNGDICMTVDITGMQSFPEYYKNGVPLTTMSSWGWHYMPNTKGLKPEDSQKEVDTGNGHRAGMYAVEYKLRKNGKSDTPEQVAATAYFRQNPHRLNLGLAALEIIDKRGQVVTDINRITGNRQELDLMTGIITSTFTIDGDEDYQTRVTTACSQEDDSELLVIDGPAMKRRRLQVALRFPYPTLQHSDDAANWEEMDGHSTAIVSEGDHTVTIERKMDATTYHVVLSWQGDAVVMQDGRHRITIAPTLYNQGELCLKIEYRGITPKIDFQQPKAATKGNGARSFAADLKASADAMTHFWQTGAAVDFSQCTDPRARELERRIVLSQYLMKINEDTNQAPQEAGLTYNTWFGRPHNEMIWWHSLQWALWDRTDILRKQMDWYKSELPYAKALAERQHYKGVRWLKMTDPWGGESPSNVGSYLIWQQPHAIYLAEEVYRQAKSESEKAEILNEYGDIVMATAEFMADFATKDKTTGQWHLKGCTGMQETLKWNEIYDPSFELQYWKYGLLTAQKWRERKGQKGNSLWEEIATNMAAVGTQGDFYLPAKRLESFDKHTFDSIAREDHPSVLGMYGLLPLWTTAPTTAAGIDPVRMMATFHDVFANWGWESTWGWDYGMAAMTAARLGMEEEAVTALMMEVQKNTYLKSGHNYQDGRLRVYLPGNGALLSAVAMMLAGWEGMDVTHANPGFPDNGKWNVKWEGLKKMQ